MQKQGLGLAVLYIAIIISSVGCSTPAETPMEESTSTLEIATSRPATATLIPVTATPTLPPPTATKVPPTPTVTTTPKPMPVLASSPEDIIGIWFGDHRDNLYWKFNEDLTVQGATAHSTLDDDPNVSGTYEFDGTNLMLTSRALRGLPDCPEELSIYQVELLGNRYDRQIRFIKVSDTCTPRVRTMTTGVYKIYRD